MHDNAVAIWDALIVPVTEETQSHENVVSPVTKSMSNTYVCTHVGIFVPLWLCCDVQKYNFIHWYEPPLFQKKINPLAPEPLGGVSPSLGVVVSEIRLFHTQLQLVPSYTQVIINLLAPVRSMGHQSAHLPSLVEYAPSVLLSAILPELRHHCVWSSVRVSSLKL